MNKQRLASKIWESANKMRSKIEANEYKDYILGFIFYKFLSDKELKYLRENDWTDEFFPQLTEDDTETVENIQRNIGYFISYDNLFSTWIAKGIDFSAENVTDALSAFSRLINPSHKKLFDNIFATLQTGLSKLGETSGARTKAIRELIYLIKDIPMDGRQDYDVLGFIYEYLISNFAANAGKKAGEFYTPHEVSLLMSEIIANHLKDRREIKIYDPTSGSGSLLINIGKCVARYAGNGDRIMYYAQELKENTYNLTRMNLVMRGILPDNIVTRNGDTLEEDWPYFDEDDPIHTYNPLYVDAVVSNPPYSQAWNPTDKESDPRYARFGLAPKGKADYAFLLHDLYHLKPDGIMTIVLPHGVLFRGGEEGTIRKNLIEMNHIDAIIGLPANVFFGTGIPTIIMVLKQKRDNTDVLIVDASKGFTKVGKNNVLRACDIKKIVDAVVARKSIPKFAERVERDTIRSNDYNLNIPRYVDSSEKAESWDIFSSMFGGIPENELRELSSYWTAFPKLKEVLFTPDNDSYCRLDVPDLKTAVRSHPSVTTFVSCYEKSFHDFAGLLRFELLDNMQTLNIAQEESVLSDAIFSRLDGIPLVDRYGAYQLLDDEWGRIAGDLEIIQTEGFTATKQVDPNMVTKKKDGKEQEVQEGWAGHILPFDLVQKNLLAGDLATLTKLEDRMSEITGEYEMLLGELSEEDKEQDFVNGSKDAFVPAEVKKALKAKDVAPETLAVLKKVDKLITEEKALKKKIKEDSAALHLKTKATIEGLSDADVLELLQKKWIVPIVDSLRSLPDTIISEFIGMLDALCKKYETTFDEVETEIADTERSLRLMLDNLTGSEFDMLGLAEFKRLLGGAKLANVKKAMLGKMFPQNGASVPEIRFAGFADDWKQRKAADLAEYSKGTGYSKGDLVDVGTPIILYGRLYTKYEFVIDDVDTFVTEKSGSVFSKGGEVVVPASGETAEDIARASAVLKSGILLGGDLNVLHPAAQLNPAFLAIALSNGTPQKELAKKAQGKSVVHIHNSDIQEITISFPTRAEQDQIVSVFTQLDRLITLHQRKLECLQNIKKACLDKMFV